MTIRQYEYGAGEAQLVPGGLRLYRHYRMADRGPDYGLTSTSFLGEPMRSGVNVAKCLAPEYERSDMSCAKCQGAGVVYKSQMAGDNFSLNGKSVLYEYHNHASRVPCDCLTSHEAPNVRCKCGFYASYSPRTNFFEQYRWGNILHRASLPTVFAVVEASGRVLMGSTGVRAEKLRIVAAAVDVAHTEESLGREVWSEVRMLSDLQVMYGIRSFGTDIGAMVRAYPQPDLSHLIKGAESNS